MLLHCNMVEWSNDTIIPLYYRKPLQHPQRTITQHSAGRINIIKWFNRFCEAHQTEALSLAQCNVLPRCGSTDQQHQTPRRQASYSCQDSLILTYMSIGYHTSYVTGILNKRLSMWTIWAIASRKTASLVENLDIKVTTSCHQEHSDHPATHAPTSAHLMHWESKLMLKNSNL